MQERTLIIDTKPWKVRLDGETLTVVDDQGRLRHTSRGHMTTGVYLAAALARVPFESTPEMDIMLRQLAVWEWEGGAS
jgi:hypothetical protein